MTLTVEDRALMLHNLFRLLGAKNVNFIEQNGVHNQKNLSCGAYRHRRGPSVHIFGPLQPLVT
jgi:hypothetical protein